MSLLKPSLQRGRSSRRAAKAPSSTRRAWSEWQRLHSRPRHSAERLRDPWRASPRTLRTGISTAFQHLPPQNYPFPSLAWSEIIKSTGSFLLLHFLRRGFRRENSRIDLLKTEGEKYGEKGQGFEQNQRPRWMSIWTLKWLSGKPKQERDFFPP